MIKNPISLCYGVKGRLKSRNRVRTINDPTILMPLRSRLTRRVVVMTICVFTVSGCARWPTINTRDGHFTITGPFVVLDEEFSIDRNVNGLNDARHVAFDTEIVVDRRPFSERETKSLRWYGQEATRLEHAHFLPPPIYILDQQLRPLMIEAGSVHIERFDIINVHPVASQREREAILPPYGIISALFNSVYGRIRSWFRQSDEETGETDRAEDYYVCDMQFGYRGASIALRKSRHYLPEGQTRAVFDDELARLQLRALVHICIAEAATELVHELRLATVSFVRSDELRSLYPTNMLGSCSITH